MDDIMKKISGWNIYSKEELKNLDNTVIVITEMIQNNQQELTRWKKDSGMYELIECQTNALYNALSALRKSVEI